MRETNIELWLELFLSAAKRIRTEYPAATYDLIFEYAYRLVQEAMLEKMRLDLKGETRG